MFAIPDFRRGWVLGLLTGIIRWLEFLALGIFAYQLTESPPLVALLAIVRVAPYALLGFFVGALTDRFDRKVLYVSSLTAMTVIAGVLAYLSATGQATYAAVLCATLATGIFWLTDMPIRRRFMSDAVSSAAIGRAMGLDGITNYATRGIGPLAGGIIFQGFGATGIFTMNCVLYAVCLLLALGFRRPAKLAEARESVSRRHADDATPLSATQPPPLTSWTLIGNPRFLMILGVTVIYNLFCAPFVAMIPVFAQKDFGFSPAAIGTLASFEGLGGLIGTLLIGMYIRPHVLFIVHYMGPVIYLSAILLLSLFLLPQMTLAALILASFGGGCFAGTQYALVYTTAPPELRGRAFGFLALGIGSATIGLWNAGWLFKTFESDVALRIMATEGLIAIAILGLWAMVTGAPGPGKAQNR